MSNNSISSTNHLSSWINTQINSQNVIKNSFETIKCVAAGALIGSAISCVIGTPLCGSIVVATATILFARIFKVSTRHFMIQRNANEESPQIVEQAKIISNNVPQIVAEDPLEDPQTEATDKEDEILSPKEIVKTVESQIRSNSDNTITITNNPTINANPKVEKVQVENETPPSFFSFRGLMGAAAVIIPIVVVVANAILKPDVERTPPKSVKAEHLLPSDEPYHEEISNNAARAALFLMTSFSKKTMKK